MAEAKSSSKNVLKYHVLINKFEKDSFSRLISSFSQAFSLEPSVAEQILKSYPIVFLSDMAREEYKVVKPRLLELSKSGMEFMVTTQDTANIPRVSWSVPPRYAEKDG